MFQIISNELFLFFHINQERAINGLKLLFHDEIEDNQSKSVINAIKTRLLGLLMSFDTKLNSPRVCISDKRNALKSLSAIIKFMGPSNITTLRFKIIATLNSTLNKMPTTELQILCCTAWKDFINNCEITAIGSLLSTIFISLLPFTKIFPDLIMDIFQYLCVRHEEELEEYWTDLFFIIDVDTESLAGSVVLKNIQNRLKVIDELNFKQKLQFYIKYLQHENNTLRIHALNFITKLLEVNRENLNELILGNNGLDPIIGELVELLIKVFREKDSNLHLACSICIGELGAIEPSHLPKRFVYILDSKASRMQTTPTKSDHNYGCKKSFSMLLHKNSKILSMPGSVQPLLWPKKTVLFLQFLI